MMEEAYEGLCSAIIPSKANGPSKLTKREKPGAYSGKACKQDCKAEFVFQRILERGQKFK